LLWVRSAVDDAFWCWVLKLQWAGRGGLACCAALRVALVEQQHAAAAAAEEEENLLV
jgi:hypothetical protein